MSGEQKKIPTKKKRTKKKRVAKVRKGQTIREARTQALANSKGSWPWPLRPMQQSAYDAMEEGFRRLGLFWHRRAGKDVFGMSVARNQMIQRIGSYVHFFPKHVHARRALWRGIDPRKGAKFIDIAFGDIEAERNNQDMMIEAYNGSTWTLLGSDNYDNSVIGGNVVGVVFSEWAMCDPRAWDFIRPILRENKGYAIFITTFRGRNHAWQMAQSMKTNPDWYIDVRTVEQTTELDGSRIITDEDIAKERADGMKESLVQQEYFCNPEAIADGAIYGRQVEQLRKDIHRQGAAWNPNKPVYCVWNIDLPVFANCVVVQPGEPPLILDAQMNEFRTLAEALTRSEQRGYPIMQHMLSGTQRDLVQQFNDLDRHPLVINNENPVLATTATTNLLNRCHIDFDKAEILLDAISGYVRRERFDSQVADLQFSDYAVISWHAQLTMALETWSCWEYNAADGQWQSKPDYSTQDRVAKTLL